MSTSLSAVPLGVKLHLEELSALGQNGLAMPSDPPLPDPSLASSEMRGEERIEQYYTRQILSGALSPGTRLPPSNEIAKEWSVGATIVQRAMRQLVAAGLVDRERKSGTVVRDRQERALIGLVIGPSLADESAYYYRALATALEALLNRHVLSLRIYDGVHPMSLRITKDYHPLDLLKIDRLYYQFKGLILVNTGPKEPAEIASWDIPRVYNEFNPKRRSDLSFDVDHMVETILTEMTRRGARRFLVVSTSAEKNRRLDWQIAFDERVSQMSGVTLEHLTLPIEKRGAYVEQQAFKALQSMVPVWKKEADQCPDAIVVMDDIVARGVCMALLQGGVESPDRINVVVASTDAVIQYYGMPVYRYEQSVMETAELLKSILWGRITGKNINDYLRPQQGKFTELREL